MTDPASGAQPDQQPDGGSNNSGYTPPATQQELNRLLGERAQRERAKFADYEEFKTVAAQVPELTQKLAAAEAAQAEVPTVVAQQLRTHLVALHEIDKDDADLFLTATDPETLLKQVNGLVGRSKKQGNVVPREGGNPTPGDSKATEREFVRGLFGSVD